MIARSNSTIQGTCCPQCAENGSFHFLKKTRLNRSKSDPSLLRKSPFREILDSLSLTENLMLHYVIPSELLAVLPKHNAMQVSLTDSISPEHGFFVPKTLLYDQFMKEKKPAFMEINPGHPDLAKYRDYARAHGIRVLVTHLESVHGLYWAVRSLDRSIIVREGTAL